MTERITLTEKEQARLMVLGRVDRGTVHVAEAAGLLDVSERHVLRLLAAYRKEGAAALAHGNRGRRPPHTVPTDIRERVVALTRDRYTGVNQVHLTELLAEREGVCVSRSTVRRILGEAGIPSPRTRRPPRHRSRRERYPQEGMLVQMDGSPHDWLQGRGPMLCLMAGIDDASGRVVGAVFRDKEDAAGYLLLLREITTTYGRPLSVYHDRHTIFGTEAGRRSLEQELAGIRHQPTQVERALQELGIGSISARSPQAKGRIERLFGSFQDRLTTEMRLAGVIALDEANAFLPAFLSRYNKRFAVPASVPGSAFRTLAVDTVPEQTFCFKYVRTVAADNTVQLDEHRLQILAGRSRVSYAKCRVEVHERLDGSVAVLYKGDCLATKDAPLEAPVLRARGGRRPPISENRPRREDGPASPPATPLAPACRSILPSGKPAPDHPWRRPFLTPRA